MPFAFQELDAEVRGLMVGEIEAAVSEGTLYYSKRFTDAGNAGWIGLLREAARNHDEHWLAFQLESILAIKGAEARSKPTGGYTLAHVPNTAEETLADGEFNRYYMCAICRKAIRAGARVEVYRAKQGKTTRLESDALVGASYDPAALVSGVRSNPAHELTRPNSGLSLRTVMS